MDSRIRFGIGNLKRTRESVSESGILNGFANPSIYKAFYKPFYKAVHRAVAKTAYKALYRTDSRIRFGIGNLKRIRESVLI